MQRVAAAQRSEKYAKSAEAAYETGTIPFDTLVGAYHRRAETKLLLIRAERAAKAAGA
jgi:hypothetical protein